METNILVTYASKNGATAEIAEKIGEALRHAGLQADVLPVSGVRDLNPYQAVILGSAVYISSIMS
jgi:menaquinone-dependent protoporphyrinogen oxidase